MTPDDLAVRWYLICPRCNAKAFALARPETCPRCGNLEVHTERAVCPWLVNRSDSTDGERERSLLERMVERIGNTAHHETLRDEGLKDGP